MLIGELSKLTGLSRDTIRFYEKKGLIPNGVQENEYNNYKDYSNDTLEILIIIKKMKGFGFTLNEITEFLNLLELNSASCENVSQKMFEKVKLIDDKIKDLNNMKTLIMDSLNSCPNQGNRSENCPLIMSDT